MLTTQIQDAFDSNRKVYGSPRIHAELADADVNVGRKRVGLFDQQPGGRFNSRHEAKLAVFDYLETFYNPHRRHSAIGQISPAAFERRYEESPAA